jgi:hypothetical protein
MKETSGVCKKANTLNGATVYIELQCSMYTTNILLTSKREMCADYETCLSAVCYIFFSDYYGFFLSIVVFITRTPQRIPHVLSTIHDGRTVVSIQHDMTPIWAELTCAVLWTDVVMKFLQRVAQEIWTRLSVYRACCIVLREVHVSWICFAASPHTASASLLRCSKNVQLTAWVTNELMGDRTH